MFAGHFGLAALVKAREPEVPLWALLTSSQLLDIAFAPLYLAGIETLTATGSGGYGEQIITAPYSHSLVSALALAGVAGALAAWRWQRRTGVIIAGMVVSHWLLDLVVHHADLALLPGNAGGLPTLGFGLWSAQYVSMGLEAALVATGAALYARMRLGGATTRRALLAGSFVTLLLVATLVPDMLALLQGGQHG
jgi:hypothetical protein